MVFLRHPNSSLRGQILRPELAKLYWEIDIRWERENFVNAIKRQYKNLFFFKPINFNFKYEKNFA